MTLHFTRYLTFALVTFALGLPAVAQDLPTVLPGGYAMSDILNKRKIADEIGPGPKIEAHSVEPFVPQWTPTPARPKGSPELSTAVSAITPSSYYAVPEVSARVREQFGQWLAREAGATDAPQIFEVVAQRDTVRDWAQIVEGDGLRPGDIADVMTSYWILNWVMANGVDSNQARSSAVRDQVRRMFNPAYVRLGGAQRQELSEALILNFLMQHTAYTDALTRGDRAAAAQLGDAAETRFRKELGVDLRQLKLTTAGFVRAG